MRKRSLFLFGMSLHPKQDKQAHVAPYVYKKAGVHYPCQGRDNRADDTNEKPERFEATQRVTKDEAAKYRRGVSR